MPMPIAVGIIVVSVSIIVLAFLYPIRSWYRNWGATKDEVNDKMLGDEELREANNVVTTAIMIESPVSDVCPWPDVCGTQPVHHAGRYRPQEASAKEVYLDELPGDGFLN